MDYVNNNGLFYTESEVGSARERIISTHGFVETLGISNANKIFGQMITTDFPSIRMRNGQIKNTKFVGINIEESSFNGTKFESSVFDNCQICGTSMQSSSFIETVFNETNLSGSNLSQCFITDTHFNKVKITGTTLLQSIIANSYFDSCEIKSVSFENCLIKNTYFANMRLANLNLEFAEFSEIFSNDVIFPFAQMPYVFGGLQYLFNTNDRVLVTSDKNKQGSISIDEYRSALDDLKIIYWANQEYFPLANVCDCAGDNELSFNIVNSGILAAIQSRNFRMLKYYCKLAAYLSASTLSKTREIFNTIENRVVQDLTEDEYYEFSLHYSDIRRLLLNSPNSNPTISLEISTNIDSKDFLRLTILLDIIEELYDLIPVKAVNKRFELRHNSDFIVELTNSLPEPYRLIMICFLFIVFGFCGVMEVINKIKMICHNEEKNKREADLLKIALAQESRNKELHKLEVAEKRMKIKQDKEKHELEIQRIKAETIITDSKEAILIKRNILQENNIVLSSPIIIGDILLSKLFL